MRFVFITQNKAAYPVGLLCEVMQVSRAGYYKWLKEKGGKRAISDETALERIREVFAKSRQTYGRRRVSRRLRKMGIVISEKRVGRLMREAGLRAVGTLKFRATTVMSHAPLNPEPHLFPRSLVLSSGSGALF